MLKKGKKNTKKAKKLKFPKLASFFKRFKSNKKGKKNKKSKKGFTLIEGVLVLGIGGLIFFAVFIAVPYLQQSQRDAQRKNNLVLIATAMNNWLASHKDTVSDAWSDRKNTRRGFCKFYKEYVGKDIVDPSTGEPYKAALWGSTNVIDCFTNKETNRGEFDKAVHVDPNKASDSWPKPEMGDIQFDNSAFCEGEMFNDHVGKTQGLKIYAIRVKLENGGYYCVDNGSNAYKSKK